MNETNKCTHEFEIFLCVLGVGLALVVGHGLITRAPHGDVVDHLSDVLIGCDDDFVQRGGRDLQTFLERHGHHGCLERQRERIRYITSVGNRYKL